MSVVPLWSERDATETSPATTARTGPLLVHVGVHITREVGCRDAAVVVGASGSWGSRRFVQGDASSALRCCRITSTAKGREPPRVALATTPNRIDASVVKHPVPARKRGSGKPAQPSPKSKWLREIRRIERADRRWEVASEKRRQAAAEKFAAAWTGQPDDLVSAQLLAVAALPDNPPAGYGERRRICIRCGTPAAYSIQYDAGYCPKCRRWLERACSPRGSRCLTWSSNSDSRE